MSQGGRLSLVCSRRFFYGFFSGFLFILKLFYGFFSGFLCFFEKFSIFFRWFSVGVLGFSGVF